MYGGAPVDLRTKLARQAGPFLEPHEHIQAVFRARSIDHVRAARTANCPRWHLLVVTDRAILVLDLSIWTYRPKRLRLRYPRNVYFGWSGSFALDGRTYGVVREFKPAMGEADTALAEMMAWREYPVVQLVSHGGAEMTTVPWPGYLDRRETGNARRQPLSKSARGDM